MRSATVLKSLESIVTDRSGSGPHAFARCEPIRPVSQTTETPAWGRGGLAARTPRVKDVPIDHDTIRAATDRQSTGAAMVGVIDLVTVHAGRLTPEKIPPASTARGKRSGSGTFRADLPVAANGYYRTLGSGQSHRREPGSNTVTVPSITLGIQRSPLAGRYVWTT